MSYKKRFLVLFLMFLVVLSGIFLKATKDYIQEEKVVIQEIDSTIDTNNIHEEAENIVSDESENTVVDEVQSDSENVAINGIFDENGNISQDEENTSVSNEEGTNTVSNVTDKVIQDNESNTIENEIIPEKIDEIEEPEVENVVSDIKEVSIEVFGPDDVVIIANTTEEIKDGDSVYSVLERVLHTNGVALYTSGSKNNIYISGIDDYFEFDYGPSSGFVYYVNGVSPSISSSKYLLEGGERIEWKYKM